MRKYVVDFSFSANQVANSPPVMVSVRLDNNVINNVPGRNVQSARMTCTTMPQLTPVATNAESAAVISPRKHVEQVDDGAEADEDVGDDFESLYKGEISKSGTPILPSKRARKAPEKIQVSKDDLAELSETTKPDLPEVPVSEDAEAEQGDVSLDQVSESEDQAAEDTDSSNS